MSQFVALAKRYWLALYWTAFACVTIVLGQAPGYYPRYRPLPPFPWGGVLVVWGVLAIETGVLYVLLYRNQASPFARRLRNAVIYAFCLSGLTVATTPTDLPGFIYAPSVFAIATLVVLCIAALLFQVTKLWRGIRHAL